MFIKIARDRYETGIALEIGEELDDLSVAALTASTIQHVSKGVTLVLAQKLKDERRRAMIAEAQDVAKLIGALNAVADTIDEEKQAEDQLAGISEGGAS